MNTSVFNNIEAERTPSKCGILKYDWCGRLLLRRTVCEGELPSSNELMHMTTCCIKCKSW